MKFPIPIVLSMFGAALVASAVTFFLTRSQVPTPNQRIREFYEIENAVHVSPHSVRKKMDQGDQSFVLVDLRSPQEYEKEHIVGAVNIPAYKDPNTPVYEEKDRIVREFRQLPKEKEIIVYCYSMPCMTGRKIGLVLADHDMFVKHLNIGWNEWRYFWNLWNHDSETPSKAEDYIVSGKDPGKPKPTDTFSPCTEGELGC